MTKDSYIKILMPNEETGQEEEMFVSVSLLFGRMWEEYIRNIIPDYYIRGMLMDLGLSNAEVVQMMVRLKVGKVVFEAEDYREVAYL